MFKQAVWALAVVGALAHGPARADEPLQAPGMVQTPTSPVLAPPASILAASALHSMSFRTAWAPALMKAGDRIMLIGPRGTPVSLDLLTTMTGAPQVETGEPPVLGGAIFVLNEDFAYDETVLPRGTEILAHFLVPDGPANPWDSSATGRPAQMRFMRFRLPNGWVM